MFSRRGADAPPAALDPSALASYVAQECGLSGVAGVAAGVLVKIAARLVLVAAAGAGACLYIAERHGLVTVHSDAISRAAKGAVGLADVDGNGVVDVRDLDAARRRLEAKAGGVLPSAAGFSAGLMLGLRL